MHLKNIIIVLLFISGLFNTLSAQTKEFLNHGLAAKEANVSVQSKSINTTVLLSEDFHNTQFPPAGWTMNIVTGTLGWSRGVGSQTYANFSTLNTTAANGYAFVNSDGNAGAGGPEHTVLRTPAINCIGQSNVWLKFNNYFLQYGASTGDVEVSTNGTSWIPVHSSHTGLALNQATPNPQFKDINISAYAANQPTVYVRFKWTGAFDYYWFIDDVVIYSRDPYDVALVAASNLNEYSVVPKVHFNENPLTLSATAKNTGGAAVSGVKVNFNIYKNNTNNLIHSVQSNVSGPLAADSSVNLSAPAFSVPVDTGYYITRYIVSMTQQDANTSNDTIFRYFQVSDTVYARDITLFTNSLDGSLGIAAGGTVIMGQNYKLRSPDKLSRVRFYVTGPAIGDTTTMFLYNTMPDGTPATLQAQSNPFIFTVAGAQWITLTFSTGTISLDTGTYFIGLKDHHTTDNLGLGYNDNNFNPGKAWVKVNLNNWQKTEEAGFPCAYVIRPFFVCAGYKPLIHPSSNVGLCQGAAATLTAGAGTAYLWSPGGQTTQVIIVSTPGTYSVSVTNAYGCSAVSDNVNVTQVNNPVINLGNDTTVCGSIILNAGGPFANYSWAGGTSNNQYLTASNTGQFIVVVTDSLGCVGIDTINVTISPNPTINLGQDLLLCHYETAVLDAGQGFTAYLWSNLANTQTISIDTSIVGLGSFNYSVTVTDSNGCNNADSVIVTFEPCVGIETKSFSLLNIYPNPAKDVITITYPENLPLNAYLKIYDIYGRVVLSDNILNPNVLETYNIKHLSNGIYFIRLFSDDAQYISKIIVE